MLTQKELKDIDTFFKFKQEEKLTGEMCTDLVESLVAGYSIENLEKLIPKEFAEYVNIGLLKIDLNNFKYIKNPSETVRLYYETNKG